MINGYPSQYHRYGDLFLQMLLFQNIAHLYRAVPFAITLSAIWTGATLRWYLTYRIFLYRRDLYKFLDNKILQLYIKSR